MIRKAAQAASQHLASSFHELGERRLIETEGGKAPRKGFLEGAAPTILSLPFFPAFSSISELEITFSEVIFATVG